MSETLAVPLACAWLSFQTGGLRALCRAPRTLTAWKGPWRLQQGETQRSRWRLESRWGLRPCKPVPALRGGPCRAHRDRPCGQSCLAAGQPAPSSLGGRGPENRPLGEGWEGAVTQAGVPEARAGGRSPRSAEDSWAAQTLPRGERPGRAATVLPTSPSARICHVRAGRPLTSYGDQILPS